MCYATEKQLLKYPRCLSKTGTKPSKKALMPKINALKLSFLFELQS